MRYVLPFIVLLMLISCKENGQKKPVTEAKNENTMTERFTPVSWLHNTNIYEVNLRQYTTEGTFNAFAQQLPRLRQMGVETLWFMPITPIAEKNRKGSMGSYYACSDYTSINPEFGTLDDFKALVKQAHGMGFKVIIDWVANHTAWDHPWTESHPEFYTRDSLGNFVPPVADWSDVIDLDYGNPELRRAMIEALAKGDEVVLGGGILGRVSKLGDSIVHVEVAGNVELQVQRPSIVQVLPKGTFK